MVRFARVALVPLATPGEEEAAVFDLGAVELEVVVVLERAPPVAEAAVPFSPARSLYAQMEMP